MNAWDKLEAAGKALTAKTQYKADLFDYLCWLEEKQQAERVPGASFLVIASDGTTCWGHTYEEAVKVAMHHDKGIQDAKDLTLQLPRQS